MNNILLLNNIFGFSPLSTHLTYRTVRHIGFVLQNIYRKEMSGGSNRETHASSSSAVLFAQSICSSNGRIIPRTVVQQMIFSNLCYGEEKFEFRLTHRRVVRRSGVIDPFYLRAVCVTNHNDGKLYIEQLYTFRLLIYRSSFDYFSQFFMLFFYWLDGMDGWNWAPTSRKIAFLHPERTKDMLDFHDYSKHSSHLKTIAI